MAKLLTRQRLVAYMPGLRCLLATMRNRANLSISVGSMQCTNTGDSTDTEEFLHTVLPDPTMGPLAPTDARFPLPGNVGPSSHLYPSSSNSSPITLPTSLPSVLTKATPSERHSIVLSQFLNAAAEAEDDAEIQEAQHAFQKHPSALECIAQECPELLKKSFLDLFPGISPPDTMTVVTLCQKTKNDMTSWSSEVESEREDLLEVFISSAQEICRLLKDSGFWADFIDPSSGQAYLGDSNPNTSLFETDERFKQLGFDIEDLGCCKCIRHSVWGTHIFVGIIFTDAQPDCTIMKEIMSNRGMT